MSVSPPSHLTDGDGLKISVEHLIYASLFVFVCLTRLILLGSVPLSTLEVSQAVGAVQAVSGETSTVLVTSPMVHIVQQLFMAVFGSSEWASRIGTALGGIALVFSPLLFVSYLGRLRTMFAVALFACSPILFASTRLANPVIWEIGFATLTAWACLRFMRLHDLNSGVLGVVFAGVTVFLAGATGYLSLLILLLALSLQFSHTESATSFFRGMAWRRGGLFLLGVLVVGSSMFMLYPSGLATIGNSLYIGLSGWWRVSSLVGVDDANGFISPLPLMASGLYETLFWVLGTFAFYDLWVVRQGDAERRSEFYWLAMLLTALVLSLLYIGATPAHALWLTVPLVYFASGMLERVWTVAASETLDWIDFDFSPQLVIALMVGYVAILALLGLHTDQFARALLKSVSGAYDFNSFFVQIGPGLLILLILLTLLAIVTLMCNSLFGWLTTLRASITALFVVTLFVSFGNGWQVAVNRMDNPRELWHQDASGYEVFNLAQTLEMLVKREADGFNDLPITVYEDGEVITRSGMIRWILRDYSTVTYVNHPAEARQQGVILMPTTLTPPDLGGDYVGQSFILSRQCDCPLTPQSALAWFTQRKTLTDAQPVQQVTLWLRQDLYNGTSAQDFQ
ncbi:MAG: ArnT family glycosyltransferase [Phototrophicaceae bacterium]